MRPLSYLIHPQGPSAADAEKTRGRQSGDHAPRRAPHADDPHAPAARPGVAKPRLIPEEIARFRALGAEAQNAPPAVDDHRPAAGVPLEGAGVLDGALVRHDVVGAGEPRDVPRQLTHGAMAGDEPEPDCDR